MQSKPITRRNDSFLIVKNNIILLFIFHEIKVLLNITTPESVISDVSPRWSWNQPFRVYYRWWDQTGKMFDSQCLYSNCVQSACQRRWPRQAALTERCLVMCGQPSPIWEKPDLLLPCSHVTQSLFLAPSTLTHSSPFSTCSRSRRQLYRAEIVALWCYRRRSDVAKQSDGAGSALQTLSISHQWIEKLVLACAIRWELAGHKTMRGQFPMEYKNILLGRAHPWRSSPKVTSHTGLGSTPTFIHRWTLLPVKYVSNFTSSFMSAQASTPRVF